MRINIWLEQVDTLFLILHLVKLRAANIEDSIEIAPKKEVV